MASLRFKVKNVDIICFLLFFSIVKIHAVPQIVQQVMKIIFIMVVLLFLLSKSINNMRNSGLLLACIFVIPSIISFFLGRLEVKTFLDGVLNAVVIYVMYSFTKYISNHGQFIRIIDDLFYFCVAACTISVVSILSQGRSIYGEGTRYEYFFGNKFSTMYLCIFLIGLTYVKFFDEKRKRVKYRWLLLVLIVLEMFLSYWVGCSTTLIGGAVMFLTLFFSGEKTEWIRKFISNPIAAVAYLVLPGFLAMNMIAIMQIPQVNHFVTGVLGKSAGLTGRTYIYSRIMEIFIQNPIFGYGYNSNIANIVTEVGNAQNGLFQMVLDYGIIGVISVCVLVYRSFYSSRLFPSLWGIKVFVFAMCICSIVEISFGYLFYLSLFLLRFSDQKADRLSVLDYHVKYRLQKRRI